MANYLGNAFSMSMLHHDGEVIIHRRPLTQAEFALAIPQCTSIVGHQDTCNILEKLFGEPVAYNRVTTSLTPDDTLYLAQYQGPRLPEGAISLPEGAKLEWFVITVELK